MKTTNQKNIGSIRDFINQKGFFKFYSRNISLQIADNFAYYSILELQRLMGISFSQLIVNHNEFADVYSLKDDFIPIYRSIKKRLEKSKSIKEFFEEKALPVFAEYARFTKQMHLKYLDQGTGNADLFKDYFNFTKINAQFIGLNFFIFVTDPVIDSLLKEYLTVYLKKIGKENSLQKYLITISSPIKKPAVMREYEEFLILAAEKQTGDKKEKLLKMHMEKWKWFPCYNPSDNPYALDHYQQELKRYNIKSARQELQKIRSKQKKHRQEYEKLLKSIKDLKLRKLIPITNMVCFYRERRNDLRREGLWYIRSLYEKIGKKLGLNVEGTCYLTNTETKEALKTGKLRVSKKEIGNRIKKYVLFANTKQNIFIEDKESIDEIINKIKEKERHEDIIKGQPASVGVVKGRVMVVSNINKLKNFKQGDVLVASMTAPDYVPAMKKAAAIITDEGGITCHAAIISRELGIPCIIGTKIATRVLKDGDMVEVDADKGIVRKL